MLAFLDAFFDFLHIAVILFNLTGWIWPNTRVAHRWLVGATAFCWLVIGPFVHAIGFCPLTEWQYEVKQARGIKDMPNSYIDYLLQKANVHLDPQLIDVMTGLVFASVLVITCVMGWRGYKYGKKNNP